MNNYELKKILNIIDRKENEFSSIAELESELFNQELMASYDEIHELLNYLCSHSFLRIHKTLELCAPITMYARAKSNSLCESICLFECLLQDQKVQAFYREYKDKTFTKSMIRKNLAEHTFLKDAIQASTLFTNVRTRYVFSKEMIKAGDFILAEMQDSSYIISTIAYTHYIESLLDFRDIPLRNEDSYIVKYDHLSYIFTYLPQRGIPQNRSLSEGLQNFYKDTLMQEYQGCCPICGIHIPHMLIASHIKPFRDCAHMIESSDHSNGILLCKNHDFLFDQGYISFDDEGNILISKELAKEDYASMNLSPYFRLPNHLMTKRRKLFLQYHRKNYFRK